MVSELSRRFSHKLLSSTTASLATSADDDDGRSSSSTEKDGDGVVARVGDMSLAQHTFDGMWAGASSDDGVLGFGTPLRYDWTGTCGRVHRCKMR